MNVMLYCKTNLNFHTVRLSSPEVKGKERDAVSKKSDV